jgi:reverse gyrase
MITQTGENLSIKFTSFGAAEYDMFLRAKRLPESALTYDYEADTYTIETHQRYAGLLGVKADLSEITGQLPMPDFLFEHQREIVKLALAAKTYAVWSDCGSGKTLIILEFARQVVHRTGGRFLIVTLNEIVGQTIDECQRFYNADGVDISVPMGILRIKTREEMRDWCKSGDGVHSIAIVNYEKFNPDEQWQVVS